MKYLLDTHTFIWWDNEPDKLSMNVLALCQDGNNQLYVSTVSLWEMQIKQQLGKLALQLPLDQLVQSQIIENQVKLLDVKAQHVFTLSSLDHYHKDPFDRLLIAQAMYEDMPILSKDGVFSQYPAKVIW